MPPRDFAFWTTTTEIYYDENAYQDFVLSNFHFPFPIPHSSFSILVTSLSQLFIAGSKGSRSYLTNKKAFTVLCSVFEALRKRPQHERSGGETREVVECFSLRLECSRQFLRPLRQNRTQSRLLHFFYDKESIKFPTHFQNKLLADG